MNSTMPLRELALRYLDCPHGHKKQIPEAHVAQKILRLVREVQETIGRQPTIEDLTPELYQRMTAVWQGRMPTEQSVDRFAGLYRSLWRYAGDLGLSTNFPQRQKRGCKKRPLGKPRGRTALSTAEGTLWGLCLNKYFLVNLRIRNQRTKKMYGIALADFREFLGHEPCAADLTNDNLAGMTGLLLSFELAAETVNERTGRIRALWSWMARRDRSMNFPEVQNVKEPRRTPRAWTREELGRLFASCDAERKPVGSIPGNLFWRTLHAVLWDCGCRVGELLAFRFAWIDLATGFVRVPGEVRKGGDDGTYRLHPDTVALLRQTELPERDLVFPWPYHIGNLYHHYGKILRRAGLDDDRKSKFHRMRRSVASHLHAAGADATAALGHSSADLTRRSYLDPSIAGGAAPHSVLFRLDSLPMFVPPVEKPEPVEAPLPRDLLAAEWL